MGWDSNKKTLKHYINYANYIQTCYAVLYRLENWPRTGDGLSTLVVVSIIAVVTWEVIFVSMQI